MARHRPLTYRLRFLDALVLLSGGVSGHAVAQTPTFMTSTTAVLPRQAPTTDAPNAPVPDLRAALAPGLDISVNGDSYPLPATGSISLLQPDGASIILEPSGVSANGQSSTLPPVTSATPLAVGGIDMTVLPSRFFPPTESVPDTIKGLSVLADQIQDQTSELSPRLDSFANGDTPIENLQGQFIRDMDTLADAIDQFESRLEGLAAAAPAPRDEGTFLLDDFGPQYGSKISDAYKLSKPTLAYIKDLRNLLNIGAGLPKPVIDATQTYWKSVAAGVVAVSATAAFKAFADVDWDAAVTTSTTTSGTGTTTSSTETETPTLYWISSKPGTDKNVFDTFCKTLDGGVGFFDSRSGSPKQGYQTELKLAQVATVRSQPWFDFMDPVRDSLEDDDDVQNFRYLDWGNTRQNTTRQAEHEAPKLAKRTIVTIPGAAPQLRLLSAQPNRGPISSQDYYFDNSEGSGVTIYIIDDGFDLTSLELDQNGRKIGNYIVPNQLTFSPSQLSGTAGAAPIPVTLKGAPGRDGGADHGTQVAIAAAGIHNGVVARADLFVVKAKGNFKSTLPGVVDPQRIRSAQYQVRALQDALSQIADHITRNGLKGRAVINLSFGITKRDTGQDVDHNSLLFKVFQEYAEWFESNDVVLVLAAGNKARPMDTITLGEIVPQRLGTPDNAIITVGGVDGGNGILWDGSVPEGSQPVGGEAPGSYPGSISVYAQAVDVELNLAVQSDTAPNVQRVQGTSFAAPQVAGLAAYFLIKPPGGRPFGGGTVARDVKMAIQNTAVHWPGAQDRVNAANNGAQGNDASLCRRSPPGTLPVDKCNLPPLTPPGDEGVTCNPRIPAAFQPNPVSWPEPAFEAAAHQFCYGGYHQEANPSDIFSGENYFSLATNKIDPDTNLPAYCLGESRDGIDIPSSTAQKLCQEAHNPGVDGSDSKIRVAVVPSPSQDGCSPLGNYKLPEGDACMNNLRNVIFECMLDNKKSPAGVWRESTPQGCWDWFIWGLPLQY